MARNKFDVDENLESPFNIKHLKRSFIYIKKHSKKMILSLVLSGLSVICALITPKIVGYAVDYTIPNQDFAQLLLLAIAMAALIGLSVFFALIRSKYMAYVGQDIIYDIRKDLFEHLQELSFQYYDDRPDRKSVV